MLNLKLKLKKTTRANCHHHVIKYLLSFICNTLWLNSVNALTTEWMCQSMNVQCCFAICQFEQFSAKQNNEQSDMKSTLFSQNLVTYLNHEEVFYAMKNANTNAMLTKSWFKNDISMIYFPFHHIDDALKELFFFVQLYLWFLAFVTSNCWKFHFQSCHF